MPLRCLARPSAPIARAAAPALALAGLAGCSASDAAPPSGLFGAAALLLVAVLAGVLGAWLGHVRQRDTLRATREALRRAQLLQTGWSWQTDAQHRLLSWSAAGAAPASECSLFDAGAQPDLLRRLQSKQGFADLALRAPEPLHGSRGWRCGGLPRHEADGAFAGFEGRAWPTDGEAQQALTAAALPLALAACAEPVLLALDNGRGWQLQQCNPAALRSWPEAHPGQSLAGLLSAWPEVLAALAALAPDQAAQELQGWRVVVVPGTEAPTRAALLQQLVAAGSVPAALPDGEGDTFSFTLSHDLRAPIRVVEGFTRIVKEDYGRQLDRVGNDHLDRVLGAAARMNLMIDALLTLARLSQQPLARQRVNLSQLAGYVVDDLRRSAPERAADIDIEAQLTAWGDPTLLRLVLENLLGNAWKYTGRCTQAQISLRASTQDGRPGFVVRDNGAGFDMRSADRLFGLFQRLHSASDFPGHGVGLASVRRILRRHGGDVWAESEPGRGASFFFTLAP